MVDFKANIPVPWNGMGLNPVVFFNRDPELIELFGLLL